jgi:hypothetical protein
VELLSVTEDRGLVVGTVSGDWSPAWKDWGRRYGLHLIEVEASAEDADRWVADGFRFRPGKVMWVTDPGPSETEYIAALSKWPRKRMRAARARFETSDLRCEVLREVTEEVAAEWIALHRQTLADFRFRMDVLTTPQDVVGIGPDVEMITVRDRNGVMLAGAVTIDNYRRDTYVAAFRGQRHDLRHQQRVQSLSRILDLTLLETARARGRARASLGWDPNLYGHVGAAGLAVYKRSVGFRPMCLDAFRGSGSSVLLSRVFTSDGLVPPVVFYAHRQESRVNGFPGDDLRAVIHADPGRQPSLAGELGSDVECLELGSALRD